MDYSSSPASVAANVPQHRNGRRDPYAAGGSSATLTSAAAGSRRSPYASGVQPQLGAGVSPARATGSSLRRPRPPSTTLAHGQIRAQAAGSFGHSQRVSGHSVHRPFRPAYTTNGRLRGGDGEAAALPLPGATLSSPPGLLPSVHQHPLHAPSAPIADVSKSPSKHVSSKRRLRRGGSVYENGLNSPQLDLAALLALVDRGWEVLEGLLGKPRRSRKSRSSAETDASKDESFASRHAALIKLVIYILPVLFLIAKGAPPVLQKVTKPPKWDWKPERRLDGRRCAMNLFVEKQAHDEFDPDHQQIKPGETNKDGTLKVLTPPKVIEGTYRTKGQMHILSRYIEAVADSFRANTKIRQHIIFAGARDGGHLAGASQTHWPPRGSHRAQFHIIADDVTEDASDAALGYGNIDAIETKFKGDPNVHVYGRDGKAGVEGDDDEAESLDLGDDDGARYKPSAVNVTALPYPSLRDMIPTSEEEDAEVVVPYLHVDGLSHARQLEVLESARPLMEEYTIRAVGMERSPDLDIFALIEFFRSVGFKTFFLGSRQLYRIDHMCEEILEEVLNFPGMNRQSIHTDDGQPFRSLLQRWGVINDPLAHYRDLPKETVITYAPFLVALPKGRRTTDGTHNGRQEMTIQTMYDLFGGYGGGGQIKTANDRKAPGKK